MPPVFVCGFECGVLSSGAGGGPHWSSTGQVSITTTSPLAGARSLLVQTVGSIGNATTTSLFGAGMVVFRFRVKFDSFPPVDTTLGLCSSRGGAVFKASDSKIYAGSYDATSFGATGISITTGVVYYIDVRVDTTANPHAIDVMVNGQACGRYAPALAADTTQTKITIGSTVSTNVTAIFDDFVVSTTSGDYPIGDGYVNHFVPTSDGAHNVAGSNDFERSATGTDITNATTDAYTLIDDVPMKSGSVAEYINLTAPPNSTDYVEVVFGPAPGISAPTMIPRAVEAVIAKAKGTGVGANNLRIALNDNGTTDDIFNGDTAVASPTASYATKQYATPPTGGAWILSAGAGNFNNLRMRCFSSDAAPDPWWASAMIEAEFAGLTLALSDDVNS